MKNMKNKAKLVAAVIAVAAAMVAYKLWFDGKEKGKPKVPADDSDDSSRWN